MITVTLTENQARLLLLVADYFVDEFKEMIRTHLTDEAHALDEAIESINSALDK